MAISTRDLIDKFGTQDLINSTEGSIAAGAFSVAGDVILWPNDDNAPFASVTFTPIFDVAPADNSSCVLFGRLMDVVSTNDQEIPSDAYLHTLLGIIPVFQNTGTQHNTIRIDLPNATEDQSWQFYIKNRTLELINSWDLRVTPIAQGPAA